ncbi:diguanylate cyclase (GGDEF)-like protein/PAS domain S-box-containing protein [Lysobacter niabensis]|uniref:Diguanylate cyclase (GGDEF)-like protein/PAS domain S-box-containing protein n=1 Tax=Agrilutibacter niabensis TaxID=380628 RepID=A0ABU1VN58_9GAMM|nr:EAL domain-containing protein [Lysobacter niabensis]MDR7098899.1 diguanylate cyclase (GGDEF)-like protein/PAS domain S-box-containing protein [Lysobacter niabensis]
MTKGPLRAVETTSDADAAPTLAALEQACNDPSLPKHLLPLLQQARDALRDADLAADIERNRYRAVFDAVPDPVSIIDWDGTVLDVNKAGMTAYQRSRDEIVGKPIEFLNPDLPRDHMRPVWETLNRGETFVIEVTNMRADGTRFPVEVHSAGFIDDGKTRIVAVARDLSSRHAAELRYRELMETIDKGIIVRDAQGSIIHVNPAAMRILELADGDMLEDDLRADNWQTFDEHGRLVSEDEQPSVYALRTGKIVESTVLGFYNKRVRQLKWLSVTCVPQFAAGEQRPETVLSLFSDVTALKRDSTLFDHAQALAHIGGWEWDTGRNSLYLTEEAQRILGQHPLLATMDDLLACLREPDRRRMRTALDHAIAHGRSLNLDLQGWQANGHLFWIRVIGEAETGSPLSAHITGTLQDITERKQAEETLRVQARTDPLTGLLNRDAVLEELETRLSDPTLSRAAVLYIDLDRFKIVNDVLGHAAGDRLLSAASRRIQRAVGSEGLIARFGGDEFLVICSTGDEPTRPERLADSILEAFSESFRMDGEEFSITASIGIAQAPIDGRRAQQLIQNADVAMYDSKRRGRNDWQTFTAELAEQQLQRLQLETHLRRAVINDEFNLVYQPLVEIDTGNVVGAEALIRWNNRMLGEMRPDHFISHAETTGDIVGIGGWVLRESCKQMRRWRDRGLALERIAVNVSYRQFLGEDLAEHVRAALAESGLPGSALELEFTERVLIEDAPDTVHTFTALRDMGVVLTIDDFGEGYSALNYLRRLPIHGLKLSQLFVQGVPDRTSDVAVCQAVTGIARSLGLSLVAEGIETERQRAFLLNLGITVGQGFLFSAGLAPEELQASYPPNKERT